MELIAYILIGIIVAALLFAAYTVIDDIFKEKRERKLRGFK